MRWVKSSQGSRRGTYGWITSFFLFTQKKVFITSFLDYRAHGLTVERPPCKREVSGSNPDGSIFRKETCSQRSLRIWVHLPSKTRVFGGLVRYDGADYYIF